MATIKITDKKSAAGRYPVTVVSDSTGDIGTGSVYENQLTVYAAVRDALDAGESIVGMQFPGFMELNIYDLQFQFNNIGKKVKTTVLKGRGDRAQGYGEVW
jgi:hypothetical protein